MPRTAGCEPNESRTTNSTLILSIGPAIGETIARSYSERCKELFYTRAF